MDKSSKSGRREFLKKGSAAIAGSTMLATFPTHLSAYVQGSDQIKIGLIGCGNRGAGAAVQAIKASKARSEERRVGKECRSRWSPYH